MLSFLVWSEMCDAYAEGRLWYTWLLLCPPELSNESWERRGQERSRGSRKTEQGFLGIPTVLEPLACKPVIAKNYIVVAGVWTDQYQMRTEEKAGDNE